MRHLLLVLLCSLLLTSSAWSQANCVSGGTYQDGSGNVFYCTGTGTSAQMAKSSEVPSAFPAGLITFVVSGSCPVGWTEVAALSGETLVGTVAANANVGTTGGADSITPTVASLTAAAQTFTGSALATHQHELPFQIPTTTTTRQIAAATFGVGTSRAATGVSAAGSANTTSAAVALSQAVSAGTPAGTNSTSVVTGTLNQFDNRSAFTRVIFCQKN